MRETPRSLLSSALWQVLPIAILVLLVIWYGISMVVHRSVTEERDARLYKQTDHQADRIAEKLEMLIDVVQNLSKNELIINGIIDSGELTNAYLFTFFRSLRLPGSQHVTISMLDYRGRNIVSNREEIRSYQDIPWVTSSLENKGKIQLEITVEGLRLAVPILYHGLPEGILLIQYRLLPLMELLSNDIQQGLRLLLDRDNRPILGRYLTGNQIGSAFTELDPKQWVSFRRTIPGFQDLTLIYAERRDRVEATVTLMNRALLIAILLDLIALSIGMVVVARRVSSPLSRFVQRLQSIRKTDALMQPIQPAGPAEIHELIHNFNKMSQQLSHENRLVENILNNIPSCVLMVRHGIILKTNPSIVHIFGSAFQNTEGETLNHFFHKLHLQEEDLAQKLLSQQPPSLIQQYERTFSVSSQLDRTFRFSSVVIDALSHETLIVIDDITEQKRTEEFQQYQAFQSGIAEMSASVLHNIGNAIQGLSYRTGQIRKKSQQLLETAHLLEKIRISVTERRTAGEPIDTILESLYNALEATGEELRKQTYQDLDMNARHIHESVEHITGIIQIQQSASHPGGNTPTVFNLKRLIEDVVTMVEEPLRREQIRIKVQIHQINDKIMLPKNQLFQSILNLIKNGQEAISERRKEETGIQQGHIIILSRTEKESIEIDIMDDGIGISSEALKHLFEYGYSTKQNGFGVGLHTTANFIRAQGGALEVFSDGLFQGTTARIRLPMPEIQATDNPTSIAPPL